MTLEKALDGNKLIFDLASNGKCKTDVVAATKERSDVYLAVFDDGLSHATGVPRSVCFNSGMFTSSVAYNYSVDGTATESGNWRANEGNLARASISNVFDGSHSATGVPGSGVVRRVNVDVAGSTLPAILKAQGGDDSSTEAGISDNAHIQSIAVSTDFGQENIQELGRFGPYTRYATFPVEVTCDFEIIATSGDLISVSGANPNLSNNTLIIKDTAGTVIDLGTQNKLAEETLLLVIPLVTLMY